MGLFWAVHRQVGRVGGLLIGAAIFGIGAPVQEPVQWWLERAASSPEVKLAQVKVKEGEAGRRKVVGELLPKVTLFSSIEHYSNPANLRPLPPTEAAEIGREGGGYPFSKNISKIGAEVQFPLFVKELWDLKRKMEAQVRGAQLERHLKVLESEGVVIGLLSQYNYLLTLRRALSRKRTSLRETLFAVEVGVKNGRFPKFKELRLRDALDQVQLQLAEVEGEIGKVEGELEKMVGATPDGKVAIGVAPVEFSKGGNYFPLAPVRAQLEGARWGVAAAEAQYFPKLLLKGSGYRAFGRAYDNREKLALNFGSVGLYLSWDLLNFSRRGELEKSKASLLRAQLQLLQKCQELRGEELKLRRELKSALRQIQIGRGNLKLRKEILADGKRGFQLGEVGIEDYLKYEDQVVEGEVAIAKGVWLRNRALAGLGLLYGVDLRKIFK
jgi:outer membrane protein TolC